MLTSYFYWLNCTRWVTWSLSLRPLLFSRTFSILHCSVGGHVNVVNMPHLNSYFNPWSPGRQASVLATATQRLPYIAYSKLKCWPYVIYSIIKILTLHLPIPKYTDPVVPIPRNRFWHLIWLFPNKNIDPVLDIPISKCWPYVLYSKITVLTLCCLFQNKSVDPVSPIPK